MRLSVADTGVGIPAEYLPHVFDKFFRVPDQSRGHGTGLGLAIVREIVHGAWRTGELRKRDGTRHDVPLDFADMEKITHHRVTERDGERPASAGWWQAEPAG